MKVNIYKIVSILIISGIYWHWWTWGPRVANDFSLVSLPNIKSLFDLPQTWIISGTESLGEYTAFTLWAWPFTFFQGFLAHLNISFYLIQRVLFIIGFLLLGGTGIWRLCKIYGLSSLSIAISTIFYLTNTYIILLVDGGQLSIALAYSLFPWAFIFFNNSIYGSIKKKVLAGLFIWGIGVFDIRFIYIFFILSLIKFIYDFLLIKKRSNCFLNYLKTALVIISILTGLNAYWILILIKFPISITFYQQLTQTFFSSFISFAHALLLLSPNWYKNVFGQLSVIKIDFFLILVLVILAPILKRRDKVVGFWLVVAIVSLFLTKGTSEPFPKLYQWFYYNIPGFSLFRDSSKFFFLVSISYSVLMGISVDYIQKRIKGYKMKSLFFIILVSYFTYLSSPVWLNKMTGTFADPFLQKEYTEVNSFFKSEKIDSSIFWIPTISPMTELNYSHPSLEASRLIQKRPFAQASVGTYELFNFLREAPYMGQLFDISNIGYIVYPPLDLRRIDSPSDKIRYYYIFLNQLSNLPWLSKIDNISIPVFKVKQHQDKLFIAPNIWWVIGSDDIYKESTKSANLSLSNNALIFPEELQGLGEKIKETPNSKIVLNNKTLIDLAAIKIADKDLIFPAQQLNHEPDLSGWWKRETSEFITWRDFLKSKYGINNQDFDFGGGWAISEGFLNLKIKSEKFRGKNILLARVMESLRSGSLKFYQGDKKIGELATKSDGYSNVRWFEVGYLVSDDELKVVSDGDINVINALASIPVSDWEEYKKETLDMKDRIVDFKEVNASKDAPSVNYKQISSEKYIVQVENLQKPSMLIFSQNYDTNWKLNGQTPILTYSFLNGFFIEKPGTYELTFEPQKYIPLSLLISISSLIIILVVLIL